MKTMTQKDLQNNFAEILDILHQGEDILINNDQTQQYLAVIMSYDTYQQRTTRPLGILKGKATCRFHEDFTISDEELLSL
jgi:hypothetical protein